jgi:hypothetical protein
VGKEQHRGSGRLVEVEVREQVAEDLDVLADVGARVGTPVGRGVEPGPAQESSSMNLLYASKDRVWWST